MPDPYGLANRRRRLADVVLRISFGDTAAAVATLVLALGLFA